MDDLTKRDGKIGRLKGQRNIFFCIAAMEFVGVFMLAPRMVSNYRELKLENGLLVRIQEQIVGEQRMIRETEAEIIRLKNEIIKKQSR